MTRLTGVITVIGTGRVYSEAMIMIAIIIITIEIFLQAETPIQS